MKIKVVMPQLGESIPDGEVTAWLKETGQRVDRDESLVEVKTDKATVEVPAPASGVLRETLAEVGQTVAVGKVIAVIETSSEEAALSVETPSAAPRPVQPAEKKPAPAEKKKPAPREEPPRAEQKPPARKPAPPPEAAPEPESPSLETPMTPVARRLARELKLDPAGISGSGAGGRVTREDVLKASGKSENEPSPESAVGETEEQAPAPEGQETVPLSPMRRRIAARMVHSKTTIPHVTTVIEADMTAVAELRKKHKAAFEKDGLKLTYLPFIMNAACAALQEFRAINGSWGGDKLILHTHVNLGIAVSVEGGLSVPVIRNAESLSVRELTRRLAGAAEHARAGKLTPDEAQGGTFTITNPGIFGAVFSTPIINPPEAAILGVGRIAETPVVRDGEIVVRHLAHLCLSYDHRIVDGETAIKFLRHIADALEKGQFDLESGKSNDKKRKE